MHATMLLHTLRGLAQQYLPQFILLGTFLTAGVGLGLIQINFSVGTSDQIEKWSLPVSLPMNPSSLSDDEISTRFWTEQPRASKKKDEPTKKAVAVVPWKFLGTVDQGKTLVAVITTDNGKVRRLSNGDALPDGSIITQISSGVLSLERDGKASTIRLFLEKNP